MTTQPKLAPVLTAAEQRLRTLVTTAPIVLFALDANGIFTLSEGKALQKLGLKPGEAIGRSVFEMYANYPEIVASARRALRGEEFSMLAELPELSLCFETHWAPIYDSDRKLGGTIGVAVDVSERNKNERAREQAETLYRSLVEQLSVVSYIAELGLEGEWLFVSPQIESLLGYSRHEWLANSANWIDHVHPDDRHTVAVAEEATLHGNPFRVEYRMYRRDGVVVWINDSGSLVRGQDGRQLLHGVLVDVTDQKQLQTRLARPSVWKRSDNWPRELHTISITC